MLRILALCSCIVACSSSSMNHAGASGATSGGASGSGGSSDAATDAAGGSAGIPVEPDASSGCGLDCNGPRACFEGQCLQAIALVCLDNLSECPSDLPYVVDQYASVKECSNDACATDVVGALVCAKDAQVVAGTVFQGTSCFANSHEGMSLTDCANDTALTYCVSGTGIAR